MSVYQIGMLIIAVLSAVVTYAVVPLLRAKLGLHVISGEAWVGDRLCASGEFSFMLTAKP